MTNTPPPPAGWYPDPEGSARRRWWDGAQWSDRYEEPYSATPDAAALRAPEGTRVETPWIWLIVFMPLLPLISILFVDWRRAFDGILDDPTGMGATLGLFTDPAYIIGMVLGWLVLIATIVFAYLDWRALKSFGVPQPFHWAWVFFVFVVGSGAVYSIGRAIVARRRTGRGIAPLWATIAVLVVSFIIVIAVSVSAVSIAFESIEQYAF